MWPLLLVLRIGARNLCYSAVLFRVIDIVTMFVDSQLGVFLQESSKFFAPRRAGIRHQHTVCTV